MRPPTSLSVLGHRRLKPLVHRPEKWSMRAFLQLITLAVVSAHGSLVIPQTRNAIDRFRVEKRFGARRLRSEDKE